MMVLFPASGFIHFLCRCFAHPCTGPPRQGASSFIKPQLALLLFVPCRETVSPDFFEISISHVNIKKESISTHSLYIALQKHSGLFKSFYLLYFSSRALLASPHHYHSSHASHKVHRKLGLASYTVSFYSSYTSQRTTRTSRDEQLCST